MRIAFFGIEGWEEHILRDAFPHDEMFFSTSNLDESTPPPPGAFDVISVFINSRITGKVLDAFPGVKLVTTRSTGYDHIDIAECKRRGVSVGYVPRYGDNTVAEFAAGLMLALTRNIYRAVDQIKESRSFSITGLRGMDVKGKVMGIVGTGRIGKEMIRIANGFGMKVVAFDPFPNADAAKTLAFTYVSLEELLAMSDVISIHCPLSDTTRHLLNSDNMKRIKKGAYLVNTARGPIIETRGLISALESGTLAGVALDVLEEEGEIKDEMKFLDEKHEHEDTLRTVLQNHILMRMPTVLITPHIAFDTREAMERILAISIETIRGFTDNKPVNLVP